MKTILRLKFLVGVTVVALLDGICGRKLAINAAAVAEEPASVSAETLISPDAPPIAAAVQVVTVGLPKDLDIEKVRQRKAALMRAGTEALLAEKLAIDAETQQLQRDKGLTAEVTMKEVPVTARIPVVELKPDETTKPGAANQSLEDMNVAQLKDLAASRNVEITSDMKKADIIAAIQEGQQS